MYNLLLISGSLNSGCNSSIYEVRDLSQQNFSRLQFPCLKNKPSWNTGQSERYRVYFPPTGWVQKRITWVLQGGWGDLAGGEKCKEQMSGLNCLEDLESGCASVSIFLKVQRAKADQKMGVSRRSDTSQALTEGTTGSGPHGSGGDQ